MHGLSLTRRTTGKAFPPLVAGIGVAAGILALGAWYFLRADDTIPDTVEVTIDGKKVDAAALGKDGSIRLPGGGTFEIKGGPTLTGTIDPMSRLGEVVSGYFSLPEGPQRAVYLDKHIDQTEAARKDLDLQVDASGSPAAKVGSGASAPPTAGEPPKRIVVRATGGAGAADSMAPELRAQLAEFVKAVNDRRRERGLPPQQGMMMIRKEVRPAPAGG